MDFNQSGRFWKKLSAGRDFLIGVRNIQKYTPKYTKKYLVNKPLRAAGMSADNVRG